MAAIPIVAGIERFYVYEHVRKDTGAVFYVGKGTANRSNIFNRHHRNQHWMHVFNKAGGVSVKIIANGLDEDLSFLVECERIDQYRKLGIPLVNQTDGGDGISGWIKSKEWREKVGAAHRGKIVSTETRAKIAKALTGHKHSAETRAKVSEAQKGHQKNVGRIQPQDERERRAAKLIGNKSRTGQKRSAEERAKASLTLTGRRQEVITCHHCLKSGGERNMRRYHFDACKKLMSCK
jgi:hypothetical protein